MKDACFNLNLNLHGYKRRAGKFQFIFLIAALLIVPFMLQAQLYYSCDQWANYTTGGYTIYNNIWGSNAGTQCLTVNAYNNWYVVANHTNTSGIKSYPNVAADVNYNISTLGSCTSSFSVTRPSSGSYNTSYDIWCNNYAYEIMLWMNKTGAVGPIAESWDASGNPVANYTNLNVGGHTWNVYRGSNGSNMVFSFLRTSNTNSGTVDIKAILTWLRSVNWFGDVNLHRIQFGFEITSCSNATFACTGFSLAHSSGSSSCTPTTITPYVQINGGTWSQTSTANVSVGNTVKFGPQPVSGGSWSWSGPNGFSASTREVTISNIQTNQAGTYVATYTNSCGAKSTQNFAVTVSGGSGGTSTLTIQENTNGFCSVDGTVDNNNGGFTGTGFANTTNAVNMGISWSVNIPVTGTYTLRWRFASTSSRPARLKVNGTTVVSSISFGSTGSWTTWTETSGTSVSLSAGTRVIRIEATGSSGLANIDYISITGNSPTPVACVGVKSAVADMETNKESGNLDISPNPVRGNILYIKSGITESTNVTVTVYNYLGQEVLKNDFGFIEAGNFERTMNLENLRKGTYILRLQAGSNLQSKLVLVQ